MRCLILLLCLVPPVIAADAPRLQMANVYHPAIALADYWVSEKYDGVRALWDGRQLRSRRGKPIHAPAWFIAPLPDTALDGELWIARGQFDRGIRYREPPQAGGCRLA